MGTSVDYRPADSGGCSNPHGNVDGSPDLAGDANAGTPVAGIAAGLGVNSDGSTYRGSYDSVDLDAMAIGPGAAPHALLYALKVFGCKGSTNLIAKALDWALDPNGDGDFSDRLDVV